MKGLRQNLSILGEPVTLKETQKKEESERENLDLILDNEVIIKEAQRVSGTAPISVSHSGEVWVLVDLCWAFLF
jgi:hypothetical protein